MAGTTAARTTDGSDVLISWRRCSNKLGRWFDLGSVGPDIVGVVADVQRVGFTCSERKGYRSTAFLSTDSSSL